MEIDQSLGLKRDNIFDTVVLYTATALFALAIVFTIIQVTVRTFGLGTFAWTEPFGRFTLIIGTFFGAAVATRNREHIKIDLVLDKLTQGRPLLRRILDSIVGIVVVTFALIAFRSTIGAAANNWTTSIGGVSGVTSGMIYLGISIGLGIMLLYEVINLYEASTDTNGIEDQRSMKEGN